MSEAVGPGASGIPAALETRLKEGEREFLARRKSTERAFYSQLDRLRAELPEAAKKELDEAEQRFRDESEQATRLFYEELEQIRTLEK